LNIDDNQLVWDTIDSNTLNEGITYKSRLYEQFTQDISNLLNANSGIGLIIDYGNMNPGFTLQAIKNHKKVGLFDFIGQADITHHVDFTYLTRLFNHHAIKTLGPIPQGQFLKELEIENLVHSLSSLPNYRDQLLAVHRLTAPQEMGDLFKVLAIQGGSHA
jgi:NADH dehydrogenase [ubiquinone] 1 alpha subcomplex assembly factor 7